MWTSQARTSPENSDFYGAALEVQVAQDTWANVVRGLTDSRFARTISRRDVRVNGRRAVLLEVEATGAGLFERGYRLYAYVVDVPGRPPVVDRWPQAVDVPREVQAVYQGRRDALIDGLHRIGWDVPRPRGTMFAWAPIPEPYREMGSVEFASMLVKEAKVATSPGIGFGPGGDGHVRFALIENEQRIGQGVRNLRRALTKLG